MDVSQLELARQYLDVSRRLLTPIRQEAETAIITASDSTVHLAMRERQTHDDYQLRRKIAAERAANAGFLERFSGMLPRAKGLHPQSDERKTRCPAFTFTNTKSGIITANRLQGHILWHGGWGPIASEHTPDRQYWRQRREGFRPYYIVGQMALTSLKGYVSILLLTAEEATRRKHLLSSITVEAREARRLNEVQAANLF